MNIPPAYANALRRGLQPRGFPFLPYRVTFSGMAATIRPVDVQATPGVPTGWVYWYLQAAFWRPFLLALSAASCSSWRIFFR